MCTLILGRDVVAPGTVLLAANRDEDPRRPSAPPMVLRERPRLVGGRDLQAGGTWLAVRDARAMVAILNRRDRSGGPSPPV
ncbi:MAG TPA: NRDE family protein, partial [Candidatus Eisenbacteria bacterium]|nr:NRDE family protein [Candidatus Eisenbacteria bacterium]